MRAERWREEHVHRHALARRQHAANDDERARLTEEARGLPSVEISSAAAANAVMLGGGYFTPLQGYMNLQDALAVARDMHTVDGRFFPVPILNLVESTAAIEGADRIALRDPNVDGCPVIAIQQVEAIETVSEEEMALMTEKGVTQAARLTAEDSFIATGPAYGATLPSRAGIVAAAQALLKG